MLQEREQHLPAGERELWRAVVARDRAADGLFLFGVTTTGIYCRPSCPARRPRRENALFFASRAAAERAGLRACKRCRPDAESGSAHELCAAVLARVEPRAAARWSDGALAANGFDPVRVRRAFTAQFGHTFHAHLRELRVARAQELFRAGRPLADAGAGAGYESESGLRAAFRAVFDRTPAEARGAATLQSARLPSPLGPLAALADAEGVRLCDFDGPRTRRNVQRLAHHLGAAVVAGANPHLERLAEELREWFAGERREFDVPLEPVGTVFELEVWKRLRRIPYGKTASYGELARELGRPGAARAVGRANGKNPLAIVIPCHRVIGASGSPTGYAGGLDRKRWLLAHEANAAATS